MHFYVNKIIRKIENKCSKEKKNGKNWKPLELEIVHAVLYTNSSSFPLKEQCIFQSNQFDL